MNLQSYKNDNLKVLDFGLKTAKNIDSPNYLDILRLDSINTFDTEGELKLKLGILKSLYDNSSKLEDGISVYDQVYAAFREDEGHAVLFGQIKLLIDFAGGENNFDFAKYQEIRNKFYLFFYNPRNSWGRYISKNILRYLLMNNLHHHLNDGQHLQWIGALWRDKLLSDNKAKKLYECMLSVSTEAEILVKLDEYKRNRDNEKNFYYPIITEPLWLEHSQYNSFHRIGDHTVPMCVVKYKSRQQMNHDDWYLIGDTLLKAQEHGKDWSNFWYNQRFLYITNKTKSIGINIHADGKDTDQFYAYIYNHPQPNVKNSTLQEVVKKYSLESPEDDGYYKIGPYRQGQSERFIAQIKEIMGTIDLI